MRLKGSYSIEAAIVISFCLVIFAGVVGYAYEAFSESVEYVALVDDKFDAVKIYRGRDEFSKLFKGSVD